MSTNFYMIIQSKAIVEKYFLGEYNLTDDPYFGYEIHIGKRSCGWKPIFRWHGDAYKSVKEMLKFLEDFKEDIEIYNEYGEMCSINELTDQLINWKGQERTDCDDYIFDNEGYAFVEGEFC